MSVGEQQRISLARVFINKPSICFLDECTSGLDDTNENQFYNQMRQMNIIYISIGHRDTLRKYHKLIVNIKNESDYEIKSI